MLSNFIDFYGNIQEGKLISYHEKEDLYFFMFPGLWNYEWVFASYVFPYGSFISPWRESIQVNDFLSVQIASMNPWIPCRVTHVDQDFLFVQRLHHAETSLLSLHRWNDFFRYEKIGHMMSGLCSFQCHLSNHMIEQPMIFQGIFLHQPLTWFSELDGNQILEKGSYQWTGLMVAAHFNRKDLIPLFYERGGLSFMTFQNSFNENALMIAFHMTHFEFIQELLISIPEYPVDVQDIRMKTIFHYPYKCKKCPFSLLKRLLKNHKIVNVRDDRGKSCLEHIISVATIEMLQLFIFTGENPFLEHPSKKNLLDFLLAFCPQTPSSHYFLETYFKYYYLTMARRFPYHCQIQSSLIQLILQLSDDLYQELMSYWVPFSKNE